MSGRVKGQDNLAPKKTNDSSSVGYVGFGDAVYSAADPRYKSKPSSSKANQPPRGLTRLVASAEEVDRSAAAWRATATTSSHAVVYKGAAATREALIDILRATPSTIHIAAHVLSGDTHREQAFLALSAPPGGSPELLATSDVARLKAPGVLVVMAGCSSATGDVVPGAGLLGLTRAWLIAGASGVVATQWPLEDTAGGLVPAFYRHLAGSSAAEALRDSQIEMLRSGNWRSNPAYWAAYQITGVAQ
jgi:CHAT domain-containing protein